jgi:enoyl-CoA hydratase
MSADVLTFIEGRVGRIRLNRPKAIHALTAPMCTAMIEALVEWRSDEQVRLVLIDHVVSPDGDPRLSRGFCAGGDVRALAESGAGDGAWARAFFHEEYRLNHLLFTYAKPIVAVVDGIVMGGGVGISQPARFRIATERTAFAMPETGIGLFPDVGGGWYLSRLPGRIGQYLGLTGARVSGADCAALGLATHFVRSERIEGLKAQILDDPANVAAYLDAAAETPESRPLVAMANEIDRLFAGDTLEQVLADLAADGSDWAAEQHAILAAKSPQACKVTLRLLAQARDHHDFADEMRVEYRVAAHVCQRPDFLEGVRALLIDKTNDPRWDPPSPEAVSDHMIDRIFAPLDAGEEWSPLP